MKKLALAILIGVGVLGLGLRADGQTNPAQTVSAQSLTGDWEGTLAGQLPLVLHLKVDASGALTATMDSPAQGATGLAGAEAKLDGTTLSYGIPRVGGTYTGRVTADGTPISGTGA